MRKVDVKEGVYYVRKDVDKKRRGGVWRKRKGWDSLLKVFRAEKEPRGTPSFRPIRADHLPDCDCLYERLGSLRYVHYENTKV
jgi:hypothetical protein